MTPFRPPFLSTPPSRRLTLLTLSFPTLFLTHRAMSTTTAPPSSTPSTPFPTHPYTPHHTTFPYTSADFHRADSSPDTDFYSTPRFVTHIDDNAIRLLKEYYAATLPRKGRILDLCSSWISHFPPELEALAVATKKGQRRADNNNDDDDNEPGLEVIGLGMNKAELDANPLLHATILQDLNTDPTIPPTLAPLSATVCVVSIDYLTLPLPVLTSLHSATAPGGSVHLVVSNRCFPTKAVGRWLRISEAERLQMVGDYLWFSGWRGVEVVELCDGRGKGEGLMGWLGGRVDPLWVVRGSKREGEEAEEHGKGEGRSEL